MILTLILLLAAPGAELPRPNWVDRDTSASLGSQRLRWPAGTNVSVSERGGELVVRYDRPLSSAAIESLRTSAPAAIADLRWNDDSLVLRATPGWRIGWQREDAGVALTFLRDDEITVIAPAAPQENVAIDLALTGVEADAAAGYPGQARRAAQALARRYPDDPRVLRKLADASAGDGDVRGAAQLYDRLEADDVAARRARAFAPGAASVSALARDGGDLSQVELTARADVALDDRFTVGAAVRRIESGVDTVAGKLSAGSTVVEGTVGARLSDDVRATLVAASALDTGVTGGGLRFVAGSSELQLRGGLLYRMPDYSTGPQVLGDGYLTRGTIGLGYRVTPGLYAQLDAGWNRYGVADVAATSDTITLAGGLDYLIRRGTPSFTIGYRLDAEYVQANRSPLLILADRENHTLQGVASGAVGALQLTGQLGYTVDRFGGDGPLAAVGLSAPIGDGWRIDGGGGLTSVSRPGFDGRQLFGRAQITRGLGSGR